MSTFPDLDVLPVTKGSNVNVIIFDRGMGPRNNCEVVKTWLDSSSSTGLSFFIHPLSTTSFIPSWNKGYSVVDIIICTEDDWKNNKEIILTKAIKDLVFKVPTWSTKTVTWEYDDQVYKCVSDRKTKNTFVKNARELSGLDSTEVNARNADDAVQYYQFQRLCAGFF